MVGKEFNPLEITLDYIATGYTDESTAKQVISLPQDTRAEIANTIALSLFEEEGHRSRAEWVLRKLQQEHPNVVVFCTTVSADPTQTYPKRAASGKVPKKRNKL